MHQQFTMANHYDSPQRVICLFIRFICLRSKSDANALVVEGVLAAIQPQQVILQIINTTWSIILICGMYERRIYIT